MNIEQMIAEAPEELRQRVVAHHHSVKRLNLAEQQAALWMKELGLANEMFRVTDKDYKDVLSRYNTETKSLDPDPKIEMKVSSL